MPHRADSNGLLRCSLNESPSEKEGKYLGAVTIPNNELASMKVPPKRKGNSATAGSRILPASSLNESPSEKEGKSCLFRAWVAPLCVPQ